MLQLFFSGFRIVHFNSGVPDRASKKLFTKEVLYPGAGKFPEPSQKLISATASRYFILWSAAMIHHLVSQLGEAVTEHMLQLDTQICFRFLDVF